MLINHLKELLLHTDLRRQDTILYITSCSLMWNWLVSALAVGATIVLYDGNPNFPDTGVVLIIAAPEIPYTMNMKKVESSVTNILNRREVTNREALINPGSLGFYEGLVEQLQ